MGFETVYGVGALVLLTALIFGVLHYPLSRPSRTASGRKNCSGALQEK
jgi:membrane protease YdiL (CAAX protease family)